MRDYRIYNRELTAYSLEGQYCINWYEDNKKNHLNPDKNSYGQVLCLTKQKASGLKFSLRFYWTKEFFLIKPVFSWRYGKSFNWLFFRFDITVEYFTVFDKIIKDHLSEHLANLKKTQ